MAKTRLVVPVLLALAANSAFAASPIGTGSALRPTVALRCDIVNSKIVQITNSTGAVISAGTRISWDAIRAHSSSHYGGSFSSPQMQPGASVQRGGSDSSSCTAWFIRQLVRAP